MAVDDKIRRVLMFYSRYYCFPTRDRTPLNLTDNRYELTTHYVCVFFQIYSSKIMSAVNSEMIGNNSRPIDILSLKLEKFYWPCP